jgi:hypothetical protein
MSIRLKKNLLSTLSVIIVIYVFIFTPVNGQIRPDFLLATEGNINEAYIVYDHQRNLHTAWGIDAVYYGLFDSLGYPVRPTQLLSANNKVVGGERIAIRNDRVLVVWQEFVQSFNSFIFGQLLTINGDPLFGSF